MPDQAITDANDPYRVEEPSTNYSESGAPSQITVDLDQNVLNSGLIVLLTLQTQLCLHVIGNFDAGRLMEI